MITFDLDGVLHINPFQKGVFPDLCKRMAPLVMEREGLDEAAAEQKVFREMMDRARRRFREGDAVGSLDWDAVANDVAKWAGYGERIDVPVLVQKYCLPDIIGLHRGADETLTWLREQGAVVGTLSNGFDAYQYPVLEKTGIAKHFQFRVSPEMVGAAKPDPRIFDAAARRAAEIASPEQLRPRLHVGDLLLYDVLGARRSGFLSVWIVGGVDGHDVSPEQLARPSDRLRTRMEAWKPLASLAPWERPESPHFEPFRNLFFSGEEVDVFRARPEETVPDFVIGRLDELRAVVGMLSVHEGA